MVHYYTHIITQKTTSSIWTQDVTLVSRRAFGAAGDDGIYTRAQLSEFWDNILISAASRKALQKFSRELIVPNTAVHGPEQNSYYAPRRDFYVDNTISPSFFKISLWTRLDQLPMSENFLRYISPASCWSSSSLIS